MAYTQAEILLGSLKQISARMGNDSSLIQASGGNTSVKLDNRLFVKASGKCLANALDEDIFVELDLKSVLDNIGNFEQFLMQDRYSANGLKPSIETTLHALMPHNVVLHCHSTDVIATTLNPAAQDTLQEKLAGINWSWVPYCRPGYPLTQSISIEIDRNKPDVLILENHGCVVGANTPEDAFCLQNEVTTRLAQPLRDCKNVDLDRLKMESANIQGAYFPANNIIHALANDPWSLELCQMNPPYPDHVVFCGISPWIRFNVGEIPPPETSYGIIPDVGVFLLPSATNATQAMLQAQADVFLKLPPGQRVNLLSDSQCNELLNWDAEKYRQKLQSKIRS